MSNITVTHAPSGLVHSKVVRSERISPHVVRVTFGGGGLAEFVFQGFDQWFRLAIPTHADDRFDALPSTFGLGGFLKYSVLARSTRPAIRNYTVRQFRADPLELDVDFVVHGEDGIAGPWAARVQPGAAVAFIDQGCGFRERPGSEVLLAADETGMPAVAGILRDLGRDTTGHALIELFDERDRQPLEGPAGVTVTWLTRAPDHAPGSTIVPALEHLSLVSGNTVAFAVGESALATGVRRHLLQTRGFAKTAVTFSGYWKRPPARRT